MMQTHVRHVFVLATVDESSALAVRHITIESVSGCEMVED